VTEHSGKNNIFFGHIAGARGNQCFYLSRNDLSNSYIQFVFSSVYLYSYLSTQSISGLAAGGAGEQFEVCLKMTKQ
jgi:hypothetical protein